MLDALPIAPHPNGTFITDAPRSSLNSGPRSGVLSRPWAVRTERNVSFQNILSYVLETTDDAAKPTPVGKLDP